MTNNTIDESRLYDDLAEYHLKMHYTYAQLAELHKQNMPHELVPFRNNPTFFCRITEAAYAKGEAQRVENELRSACVSAPTLIKAIRTNEALGYLDTKNLNSQTLYDLLNEHFGLPFKYRQFVAERNK